MKKIEMCFAQGPTPPEECNHHVLQTRANEKMKTHKETFPEKKSDREKTVPSPLGLTGKFQAHPELQALTFMLLSGSSKEFSLKSCLSRKVKGNFWSATLPDPVNSLVHTFVSPSQHAHLFVHCVSIPVSAHCPCWCRSDWDLFASFILTPDGASMVSLISSFPGFPPSPEEKLTFLCFSKSPRRTSNPPSVHSE